MKVVIEWRNYESESGSPDIQLTHKKNGEEKNTLIEVKSTTTDKFFPIEGFTKAEVKHMYQYGDKYHIHLKEHLLP